MKLIYQIGRNNMKLIKNEIVFDLGIFFSFSFTIYKLYELDFFFLFFYLVFWDYK